MRVLSMIENLTIKNFRGFKEVVIKSLNKINLISGKNNVGKTALLEAFFLLLGSKNAEIPMRLNTFRSLTPVSLNADDLWGWLFYNRSLEQKIELKCKDSRNTTHTVTITLGTPEFTTKTEQSTFINDISNTTNILNKILKISYSNSKGISSESQAKINQNNIEMINAPGDLPFPFSIYLASNIQTNPQENAKRFSNLEVMGQHEELLESLKIIEPRLNQLSVSYANGIANIVGDFGFKPMMPISYMGDGINRLLSILLAITTVKNGCLLVDEMENGFHYSVMPQVWQAISDLSTRLNVQVIATTHSLEFVRSASQINKDKNIFSLHRLERINNEIRVISYDQENLDTSNELNWEVR
jgi:AAA15 family ATPase/GTPase